jgi:hypothetical protein
MTSDLEIKFKVFAKFEPVKHLSRDEILRIVKAVPSLVYSKHEGGQESIKIKYENSNRILLVTGIAKEALDEMLKRFHSSNFWGNNSYANSKTVHAKIIAKNGFWVTIETIGEDTAAQLKKYLRTMKRTNDQHNPNYKVEGRRIRIVILKEDFLSILIDAMT